MEGGLVNLSRIVHLLLLFVVVLVAYTIKLFHSLSFFSCKLFSLPPLPASSNSLAASGG